MHPAPWFAFAVMALCAASLPSQPGGRRVADPVAAPSLDDAVRVYAEGRPVALEALWDRLAEADVVFLGETHLDETTHRFQLAALQALLARRENKVVLLMEMFERDEQPHLDDYLAGRIDEPTFRARTNPWGNYDTAYRPLVEAAKRAGARVGGANLPQGLRAKLAFGGSGAFDQLGDAERALLPPEILPNKRQYWERVARATRGHMGGNASTDPQDNLYSIQSLWDNCMGFSCAEALERYPGHLVLHVNGGFHTAYRDGTAHQLIQRKPDAKVLTVDIAPSSDLLRLNPAEGADRGDFVVYAAARGRGLDEGMHGVAVARELEFRLHVPKTSSAAAPVPLLVWLCDDGLRASEGLAYWRLAVGDSAAVAAVEPPFQQREADLHLGGRWTREGKFRQDLGPVRQGLARLRRYLLRHYPLDRDRVVFAGQGVGGAAVVSAMVYNRDLDVRAMALTPTPTHDIGQQGLPDPGDYRGRLRVLSTPGELSWWQSEVQQYASVGVQAEVVEVEDDPARQLQSAERILRRALGLSGRPIVGDAMPTWLVLEHDSPLARHWALLMARTQPVGAVQAIEEAADFALPESGPGRVLKLGIAPPAAADAAGIEVVAMVSAAAFADGRALPLYPGPFGGSTVLVVPAQASAEERAAWQKLADQDVIKRRSRFCRLYIAYEQGGPTLAEVLAGIRDAGRRNALIVPARYCAGATAMRALEAMAAPFAADLALAWSPGLGGELASAAREVR